MLLVRRSRATFLKDLLVLKAAEAIFSRFRNKNKYKFYVLPGDKIATHTIVHGLFEAYEIEAIKFLIRKFPVQQNGKKNMLALDVGANIGAYCIGLCDEFHSIHAFEPNPAVFKVLEANLRVNSITNVTAHQIALGAISEALQLYEAEEWNVGTATLISPQQNARIIATVDVCPGDEAIRPLMSPDDAVGFIKMDVEGHESHVISGLRGILSDYKPLVSFEVRDNEAGSEVLKEMRALGYNYFYWIERRKSSVVAAKWRRVLDLISRGSDFYLQPINRFENSFYSSVIASTIPLV